MFGNLKHFEVDGVAIKIRPSLKSNAFSPANWHSLKRSNSGKAQISAQTLPIQHTWKQFCPYSLLLLMNFPSSFPAPHPFFQASFYSFHVAFRKLTVTVKLLCKYENISLEGVELAFCPRAKSVEEQQRDP